MSPFSMVGTKPLYRCKSEPQIAVEVIFTIASRLLRILGSGTSTTCTSRLPYQQLAFITVLLLNGTRSLKPKSTLLGVLLSVRISTMCCSRGQQADLRSCCFRQF